MALLNSIILGIIEGITEFLPISSTGHLIIAESLFPLNIAHAETFMICIQFGAIAAVVQHYPHIFLKNGHPSQWFGSETNRILIAILPIFILGGLFHGFIKNSLFSSKPVIIGLFLGSILMFLTDIFSKNKFRKHPYQLHLFQFKRLAINKPFVLVYHNAWLFGLALVDRPPASWAAFEWPFL